MSMILVFSKDLTSHVQHLREVFFLCQEYGLTIGLPKCQFCCAESNPSSVSPSPIKPCSNSNPGSSSSQSPSKPIKPHSFPIPGALPPVVSEVSEVSEVLGVSEVSEVSNSSPTVFLTIEKKDFTSALSQVQAEILQVNQFYMDWKLQVYLGFKLPVRPCRK